MRGREVRRTRRTWWWGRGSVMAAALVLAGGLGTGAGPGVAQAEGPGPQAPARALRVMTYNIKHGEGNDRTVDLARAAAVIRAHAPDVVALQEVDRFWDRSGGVDQPAWLARELRMHSCFGANLDHQPDRHAAVPHQYGTLLLSREPILECTNTLLPRVGSTEQRGLLEAVVNVRGVPLRVFNTHLQPGRDSSTAGKDGRESRRLQILAIGERIDSRSGPMVLMGDLNARPTDAEMKPLQDRMQDAWVLSGQGQGNTSSARLDPNRPPTVRIDYAFVTGGVVARRATVPIDKSTRLASDHYPVVVDVDVPGSAAGVGPSLARTSAGER